MPKTEIQDWSATASNNTDIGGNDIDENCLPAGINNAIREMMAQMKQSFSGTDNNIITGSPGAAGSVGVWGADGDLIAGGNPVGPGPFLHVNDGQSNALAKFSDDVDGNEPLDRQTSNVSAWNGDANAWVSAPSWKAAPFAGVGAPHGSDVAGGAPQIGLSFAQRFAAHYGGQNYLTTNARSGRSIEEWIDTATGTPMYDEMKAKIEAALATPELAALSYVTTIVRTQSEEDFNHVSASGPDGPGEANFPYMPFVDSADFNNNGDIYQAYYWALEKLWARLTAEAWWGPDSALILNSGSNLHTRYMPIKAMADWSRTKNNVVFVDCSNMPTGGTSAPTDNTHFSGPSIDTIGYYLDFDAYQRRSEASDYSPTVGGILSNRVGEPYRRGDDTIVLPSDAVLDASLKTIAAARTTTLTIAAGVVTVTGSFHAVDTEGGAASDTLSAIGGASDGQQVVLRQASASRFLTFAHKSSNGGGRFNLNNGGGSRVFTSNRGKILLQYDATLDEWTELSFYAG